MLLTHEIVSRLSQEKMRLFENVGVDREKAMSGSTRRTRRRPGARGATASARDEAAVPRWGGLPGRVERA